MVRTLGSKHAIPKKGIGRVNHAIGSSVSDPYLRYRYASILSLKSEHVSGFRLFLCEIWLVFT